MRNFYCSINFQNLGTGYNINHIHRGTYSSVQAAASATVREAKKKYGRRFRVVDGAGFTISVLAGVTQEKEVKS